MYFTFQGHLHRQVGWLIYNVMLANYSGAFWDFIRYELLRKGFPTLPPGVRLGYASRGL